MSRRFILTLSTIFLLAHLAAAQRAITAFASG